MGIVNVLRKEAVFTGIVHNKEVFPCSLLLPVLQLMPTLQIRASQWILAIAIQRTVATGQEFVQDFLSVTARAQAVSTGSGYARRDMEFPFQMNSAAYHNVTVTLGVLRSFSLAFSW